MKKFSLIGLVTVIAFVLFSVSLTVAFAQYETEQTSDVTISSNGIGHIDQSSTVGGVSIDIAGTPGSTGSVSTATYTSNPQPDADAPSDATLTHFVVVTFNFDASDFQGATITISYSDADVEGLSEPIVLYKYIPESNSFIQLNAVVDSDAKTITTTVSSTTDPLFAIGGTTVKNDDGAFPTWIIGVFAAVAAVVVIAVVLMVRRRKPSYKLLDS
jgi:hypothetical protein